MNSDAERTRHPPHLLTVAEVADMLRVSKMTVYRLIHAEKLVAFRVGRSFRVPRTAVAALVDNDDMGI